MSFEYNRNLQDSNFISTVTLLAAGANTATFDLEQVTGGDIEKIVFELAGPALLTAQLTDAKVVTYTCQPILAAMSASLRQRQQRLAR